MSLIWLLLFYILYRAYLVATVLLCSVPIYFPIYMTVRKWNELVMSTIILEYKSFV